MDKKPIIQYPCLWEYKVIGSSENDMKTDIDSVLSGKEYTVLPSKSSSKNKYLSLSIEITVANEEERNNLFIQLQQKKSIRMIL